MILFLETCIVNCRNMTNNSKQGSSLCFAFNLSRDLIINNILNYKNKRQPLDLDLHWIKNAIFW